MTINIKVITKSKSNSLKKLENENYILRINTSPVDGKANKAIIEYLADLFNVKKYDIKIIAGEFSNNKIIEINIDKNSFNFILNKK